MKKQDYKKLHFDTNDSTYNKKHLGKYILHIKNSNEPLNYGRLYLDYEKQKEFYKRKTLEGNYNYNQTVQMGKQHIFTHFQEYEEIIITILDLLFNEIVSSTLTRERIKGIYFLFQFFNSHKYSNIKTIGDIQLILDKENEQISDYFNDNFSRKCINSLFCKLQLEMDDFLFTTLQTSKNPIEGYSSNTLHLLDLYARKELDKFILNKNNLTKFLNNHKDINLFCLDNLKLTFSESNDIKIKNKISNLALKLYNVDLKRIANTSFKINSINIDITNSNMYILWLIELFDDFPFCKQIKPKYNKVFHIPSFFSECTKKTKHTITDVINYFYPQPLTLHPLILFLLIREGVNSEAIANIKVVKKSKYIIKGIENDFSLNIRTTKYRSHSEINIFLDKKTLQYKYLHFFLDLLQNTYKITGNTNFFQYYKSGKFRTLNTFSKFFNEINLSNNSLIKKYEIYESNGSRLKTINHKKIRPATKYQNDLQGFSNYEKQIKLDHSNENVSMHYDNNIESTRNINLRIYKTQMKIHELFIGKINRDYEDKTCINGLYADCSDPKKTSKNDFCIDWYKCLINCHKANVFPETHGPIIYARLKYIKNLQYEYLNYDDWEKEYKDEYPALINVLLGFTKKERLYSFRNYKKFTSAIKIRFGRKDIKMKRIIDVI